jgi:hypothetical protein
LSQQLPHYVKQLKSPLPPRDVHPLLRFSPSSAEDTPPRGRAMATPPPNDAPQAFNRNGNERHCVPCKKEKDKNGKNHALPVKRTTRLCCMDSTAAHARSPSAHQVTSKHETAARSMCTRSADQASTHHLYYTTDG